MISVEELKKKLLSANSAYRQGTPIMSDQEYDDLLEVFQNNVDEVEYSLFRNMLFETKGKVSHPFIMGSLDKLKIEEPENIKKFLKNKINGKKLNVSSKVDGISCRLHYENGKLISASTRGNGLFGEDITDKIQYVKYIPHTILERDAIDIRGELVIFKEDFENMKGFANPRNACAGIINRKEYNKEDIENISFVAYTILGNKYTKEDQFEFLDKEKFYLTWYSYFEAEDYNKDSFINELFDLASVSNKYDTDGLVICAADYKNEEEYRPDKCVAVKINQLKASTVLLDIDWEGPSKSGVFVPVGLIEPVDLGGSTISRVTLHNLDFISEMGLMYGSKINIIKSGDVIPKVTELISNDSSCIEIKPIEYCPCCGSILIRDGVNMRCKNDECGDKILIELYSFIKKLGVKSATDVSLKNYGITSFKALANFKANPKKKSETKLEKEIYDKVFTRDKRTLISAMNFDGISDKILDKIFDHYGFDVFEKEFYFNEETQFWTVDKIKIENIINERTMPYGVGKQFLEKFINGINTAVNRAGIIWSDVKYHYIETKTENMSTNIKGYIVVTGNLNSGSRNSFLEKAKANGWESQSSVNKKTTYLINNDITSNSSKNRKAKELGIKIISEEEFLKLLNESEFDLNDL